MTDNESAKALALKLYPDDEVMRANVVGIYLSGCEKVRAEIHTFTPDDFRVIVIVNHGCHESGGGYPASASWDGLSFRSMTPEEVAYHVNKVLAKAKGES